MARKPINFKTTVVENREHRLGTITSWDGSASELAELSNYSLGDGSCSSKGRACQFCEQNSPFVQGSSCSESMVLCQLGYVRGAALVQHSPVGCAVSQAGLNTGFKLGLKRHYTIENEEYMMATSNLEESDMVFGGADKLRQAVTDVFERVHPKIIFISSSCATAIIGDDIDGVADELQEQLGIPVIPTHCEGFRSKHWTTGFDASQHAILRQIVQKPKKKQEDLVNVVHLFGSDVFTPMFKELNLRPNFAVDFGTVEGLQQLSEAACTVGFCYTLSSYLGAGLEQEFGVPEVHAPQPYGIEGTSAWLREIGRLTNREELVEKYIAKEIKRITPKIKEFKKKLKGVNGFVSTGSAYAHAIVEVLRELDIQVDGTLVFHHDPIYDSQDPRQDTLAHVINTTGDIPFFSVGNRQQFQFYQLLKRVKPDFIAVRHGGLASLASYVGVPALSLGDESSAIGFQGILNLGELIIETLARKRFSNDIAAHVKLPYTQWWLDQTDPYILAKNPGLIYEDDEDTIPVEVGRVPVQLEAM